jgi:RNA polymerase sigma-32 factor
MVQAAGSFSAQEGLECYYKQIRNHELLTRNQEKKLIQQYQQADDGMAADRLVRANLRLVVKIAHQYHHAEGRYALGDLIQQGNLGLMNAVQKFDARRKTKFSYYAAFWIRANILKYMIDNYSFVRIGKTQSQRKLFFRLKKTKEALHREGLPSSARQIAQRIGVSVMEVEQMEQFMGPREQSLNTPCRQRNNEQLIDRLEDQHASAEEVLASWQLTRLLRRTIGKFKSSLASRELEILESRIVARDPMTLQKLGDHFGVSKERIRQIEANIINKLRIYMDAQLPDLEYYMAGFNAN